VLGREVVVLPCLSLGLLLAAAATDRPAAAFPEIGILQFKVEHNLETPDCLANGTCFLQFEELDAPGAWLDEIEAASNLAVLHWDRGIPWLVFDPDLPTGADREAFYDARLDAATVGWLDAYAAHFQSMGKGYLAVSLLDGSRSGYAPLHLGVGDSVAIGPRCPDFSPGTQVTVDPGTGPVVFDLARSYRNFVLYLAEKLGPAYLALIVEANLIEETCPARAASLYALYRSLHDVVEAELGLAGASPLLFATLSYPPLLDYARQDCFPSSSFQPCGAPQGASPPAAGVEACYPMQLAAIDALNLGGRLDLLALSFYPDALEMNPTTSESPETVAYLLEDWNEGGACTASLLWPDAFDPMAALDRLGWTGPIAIAETSARACPSPLRFSLPAPPPADPTEMVFEIAGSRAAQAAWTQSTLAAAIERDAVFYLHGFLRDYPPVGVWTVDQGLFSTETQQLFNLWPCSGLQDVNGQLKPELAAIGVPESDFSLLLASGAVLLLFLCFFFDTTLTHEDPG
jgi:hypothetical protein